MLDVGRAQVRLAPIDESHRVPFQELCSDAEVMRHVEPPLSARRAANRFDRLLRRARRAHQPLPSYAIRARTDGRLLGFGGVASFDSTGPRAEVGMILRHEAQRRGIGTEVLIALIDAAFAALPLAEVWVQYRDGHSAAAGLVRRVGLEQRIGDDASTRIAAVDRESWMLR